jgi:hypothetical protein
VLEVCLPDVVPPVDTEPVGIEDILVVGETLIVGNVTTDLDVLAVDSAVLVELMLLMVDVGKDTVLVDKEVVLPGASVGVVALEELIEIVET